MGFIGFAVFLGACVWAIFTMVDFGTEEIRKNKLLPGIVIVLVGVLAWYACASVVIIQAGDRGAVFSSFTGVKTNTVLGEGIHVVPKVVNKVTIYDVYTKTFTDKIESLSSDGLKLTFDVSIRFRINDKKVALIKQNVGTQSDVFEKILYPTARSKMRDVSAKFTAEQAYASKRDVLQEKYQTIMNKFFAEEEYLIAEQILIRKVSPPEALVTKITETKVAEQEVVVQRNVLKAEKQKKLQEITKAQAQAEALRIKARAIAKNPEIIELERIGKWDGKYPTTYFAGSGATPLINLK